MAKFRNKHDYQDWLVRKFYGYMKGSMKGGPLIKVWHTGRNKILYYAAVLHFSRVYGTNIKSNVFSEIHHNKTCSVYLSPR